MCKSTAVKFPESQRPQNWPLRQRWVSGQLVTGSAGAGSHLPRRPVPSSSHSTRGMWLMHLTPKPLGYQRPFFTRFVTHTPINQVTQPPVPQTFSISVHLARSLSVLAHHPCPLKHPLLLSECWHRLIHSQVNSLPMAGATALHST